MNHTTKRLFIQKESYRYSYSQLIEAMNSKYKFKIEKFEKLYKSDKPRSIEIISASNSVMFLGRCPNHYTLVYRYNNRTNKEEDIIIEHSYNEFVDFPIREIFDNKLGW